MDKSLAPEVWLLFFHKNFNKLWNKKIGFRAQDYKDKTIHIVVS
jgi:hypothetical protein